MTDAAGGLVDDGVSSPAELRMRTATDRLPFGFVARHVPADLDVLWHEVTMLSDGRLAAAVGHCSDPDGTTAARTRLMAGLRSGAEPSSLLATAAPDTGTAACVIIDRETATIKAASTGSAVVAVASPYGTARALGPAGPATRIPAGATVLLCSGEAAGVMSPLSESLCTTTHPETAVDHLLASLSPPANPGLAAVLYRQPPAPLDLTFPAEPGSLAPLRAQLRPWLAVAGVDAEPSADVLLAIGEAASNSAEHSVSGVGHPVDLKVRARLTGSGLHMSVSDTGMWKPATGSPGHRGHGIKLINALVDSAELTTGENGTTVDMFKDLSR